MTRRRETSRMSFFLLLSRRWDGLRRKSIQMMSDAAVKSIDRAEPTDAQKRKAAELAAAAREAMLKLDADDSNAYPLYVQLRKDIEELLTADQKEKLKAPITAPAGAGGFGW